MSRRIQSLLAAAAVAAIATVAAPTHAAAQRTAHAAEAPKGATVAVPATRTAATTAAVARAAKADTARPRPGATPEGAIGALTFERESYSYARDGRRDPFSSLMDNGELRPLISDLTLAVIAYDPNGGSVAVLRDVNTKEQYRVRVGQQLGRMRVAAIDARQITFTIEEFGFSRQETLALSDTTTPRTQQ